MLRNINSKPPLVSVIIPTFNRSSVYDAISSVLSQDYENLEIIVINDSPRDEIGSVVAGMSDHIVYYHDGVSRGGGGARKLGVGLSHGEYVAFLDDDDEYCEGKIKFLLEAFEANPEVDACFGRIVRSTQGGELRPALAHGRSVNRLSEVRFLHTNSSLIKANVFSSINFPEELKKFQDTYFHILLICNFSVYYVDVPVAVWNDENRADQITRMGGVADYISSFTAYRRMVFRIMREKIGIFRSAYLGYRLFRNFLKTMYLVFRAVAFGLR